MTEEDILARIEALVKKYEGHFDPPIEPWDEPLPRPTPKDWQGLERKFGCKFPAEFLSFSELMPAYNCPGLLQVAPVADWRTDGTLGEVYDAEMGSGRWNQNLIPFLHVGNGDYFCLTRSEGPHSGVYYYRHDDGIVERLADSFAAWLERLEYHLNGEDEPTTASGGFAAPLIQSLRTFYAGFLPRR